MNYEEIIGKNIKKARTSKGVTQRKLYEWTEIQDSTICQFEKGKRIPGLDSVVKIARALNVSIDSIVWGDENTVFIDREPDEGRKIVTAIYYLWSIGVISAKDYSLPYSDVSFSNYKSKTGSFLGIRKYPTQIMRLLKALDDIDNNKETYGDKKDEYIEMTLDSVAKDINSKINKDTKK